MRRRHYPGELAMTYADLPEGVETEVVTSAGEVVTLEPWVALQRHLARQDYEERKRAFCLAHNQDPDTFRHCVDCGNTGYAHANHLPCRCAMGARQVVYQHRKEAAQTAALRELIRHGGGVS